MVSGANPSGGASLDDAGVDVAGVAESTAPSSEAAPMESALPAKSRSIASN